MSDFSALAAELETFAKAKEPMMEKKGDMKGDDDEDEDKKVMMASEDKKTMEKSDDMDMDDKPMMGKAMTTTLEDGSQVEAIDATEVIQQLQAENSALRTDVDDMKKAMGHVFTAMKQMRGETTQQSTLLKAMRSTVANTAGSGSGRRTMVSIAEKLVTSQPEAKSQPTAQSVMMKAQELCHGGKLGWEALPRLESFQLRGQLGPPDLLARFPALLSTAD